MLDDAPAVIVCAKCKNPLWDSELAAGRWVCGKCQQQAFERLRELPRLFRNLESLAAITKGSSGGGPIGGSRELPVPLKLGVVTQLQAIEDDWRKALRWPMGATRHHADIDGVTTFLINQLGWVVTNYPDVGDDLKSIGSIHARLETLDTGEPRARRFEVLCSEPGCTGRMPITMRDDNATCPECGTDYTRTQLMRLDSEYGPNQIRSQEEAAAADAAA
jgi:hypothetical protein